MKKVQRRYIKLATTSILSWGFLWLLSATALAVQPATSDPEEQETVRTLFVPFEDLKTLLDNPVEHMFMTRKEYSELKALAKTKPVEQVPLPSVMLSSSYDIEISDGRATIAGVIDIELLKDGFFEIPIPLDGVGLRSGTWDGDGAPILRNSQGELILVARKRGRHQLRLEMTLPVAIEAAQQSLNFEVPTDGASGIKMRVPGNVEVKQGGHVIDRAYDESQDATTFELLAQRGPMNLVLSLNNRRFRDQKTVIAKSVYVDEVTTAYEQLHATVTMDVIHGEVDEFLFQVPDRFQVTDVEAPQVAQWGVNDEQGQQILRVLLNDKQRGLVTINIRALRTGPRIEAWSMPVLQPLEVVNQVAVLGLLADARLELNDVEATNLIPINNTHLSQALPKSVFEVEPGAPIVRAVVAFYSPGGDFDLAAQLSQAPPQLIVDANMLLTVGDQGMQLRGGFQLTALVEKRKHFAFVLPSDWNIQRVTLEDDTELETRRFRNGTSQRIQVTLAQSLQPGAELNVFFQAKHEPAGWLDPWTEMEFSFPEISVDDATVQRGAFAVQSLDDMKTQPVSVTNVNLIGASEKAQFGLDETQTDVAYRFKEANYSALLQVVKIHPWISARTYSFVQVLNGRLVNHYEVVFDIRRARTSELKLILPSDTPESLSISGLDSVAIKQYSSEETDAGKQWTVSLEAPTSGMVRLAVDFQQTLRVEEPQGYVVPLMRAADVAFQTSMVAIEGDPELDIQIDTEMRLVDIGEMAEADYTPGRRLLGAFASIDAEPEVKIDVIRRPLHGLPAAIVERAELVTVVSTNGRVQSAARYALRTKDPFIEIALPEKATLWSVVVDDKPARPQRDGDAVLIAVPSNDVTIRDVRIVYETTMPSFRFVRKFNAIAPQLMLKGRNGSRIKVPQADLVWYVHLPGGYELLQPRGTVFLDTTDAGQGPMRAVSKAIYDLGGGVHKYEMRRMLTFAHGVDSSGEVLDTEEDFAEYGAEFDADSGGFGGGGAEDEFGLYADDMESQLESMDAMSEFESKRLSGRTAPTQTLQGPVDEARQAGQQGQEMSDPFGDTGERDLATMNSPESAQVATIPQASQPFSELSLSGGLRENGQNLVPQQGAQVQNNRLAGEPASSPNQEALAQIQQQGTAGPGSNEPQSADPIALARQRYWALQGLRSLKIDLSESGEALTFRSLGADPTLSATLFDAKRFHWLAIAAGLIVGFIGFLLTRRSVRTRANYVIFVVAIASVIPIMVGEFDRWDQVCQYALYAGLLLVPYYVTVFVASKLYRASRQRLFSQGSVVAGLLIGICFSLTNAASAQDDARIAEVIRALEHSERPIDIPANAIIVPYKSQAETRGDDENQKLLVPYKTYIDLWNRAYPENRIQDESGRPDYSIAGVDYTTILTDDDYLIISGTMDITLFKESTVEIPLPLSGGVLTKVILDGRQARLKTIQQHGDASGQARQQQVANAAPNNSFVMLLQVQGKGTHRLELAVRLPVSRQGGWRIVTGQIPAAIATAVAVTVPMEKSVVRLGNKHDASQIETSASNEKILTSLGEQGMVDLQWRPSITQGEVDTSLTAESTVLFDVREDGLRTRWEIQFQFGQSLRERFDLLVPGGYLVESVEGNNVRGWDIREQDDQHNLVTVSLLKAVRGQEQFVLNVLRAETGLVEASRSIQVPAITTPDAALHRGSISIRRSPVIELQTTEARGVSRTDITTAEHGVNGDADASPSPLGIQPYQAFRFASDAYSIRLEASPLEQKTTARFQTLVTLGETEANLESQVTFDARGREVHQVELSIPQDLELEKVAADSPIEWSVAQVDTRKILRIFFSSGQQNQFSLRLAGRLDDHLPDADMPLPVLVAEGVSSQQGDIAILTDTSLDVSAVGLDACESVLANQLYSWLGVGQRSTTRLAIRFREADYSGMLRLKPRQPRITCDTISNIRLTYQSIEETVLLEFAIDRAGVDELSFLLPAALSDARIKAPLLRQTQIEPVPGADQAPSRVRVTLQLQDKVIGQYVVVIENDRALSSQLQTAPFPLIETGTTKNRYVVIQNVGRDEVTIQNGIGVQRLTRGQSQWQDLSRRLQGGDMTSVYVVDGSNTTPVLEYQTNRRQIVETAGATIGLSQTVVVVDDSGAYRAMQTYKVNNRIEQYLEIEMPTGAELWTAVVALQPSKPTLVPGSSDQRRIRIPLVKTAEGDLDYDVVLKYGGKISSLSALRKISFPLIRTVNINVELSQVRLFLPENHRWFGFDGTAIRVDDQGNLMSGMLEYEARQIERLRGLASSKNDFTKARVASNLKQLKNAIESKRAADSYFSRSAASDEAVQQQLDYNARVIQEAEQTVAEAGGASTISVDNRGNLNTLLDEQRNGISRNSATKLGTNFDYSFDVDQPVDTDRDFNSEWFRKNSLSNEIESLAERTSELDVAKGKVAISESVRDRVQLLDKQLPQAGKKSIEKAESLSFANQFSQQEMEAEQRIQVADGGNQALDLKRRFQSKYNANAFGNGPGSDTSGVAEGLVTGLQTVQLDGAGLDQHQGLASLDFVLPERGTEYLFSTPRGEVEITARVVSQSSVRYLIAGVWLAGIAIVVFGGVALLRTVRRSRAFVVVFSIIAIVIGVIMSFGGLLPLIGLFLILSSIALLLEVFGVGRSQAAEV